AVKADRTPAACPECPSSSQTLEVHTMDGEFEHFNDQDEEWLTELEIRATDLQNELFDWREAHSREVADTGYGRDGAPRRTTDARTGALRAQPRQAQARQGPPPGSPPAEELHHIVDDDHPDRRPARLAAPGARRTLGPGAYPDAHRPGTTQREPRSKAAVAQEDRAGRGRSRRGNRHRVANPVPG